MNKLPLLIVLALLFGACQLLHFFSPAAQNKILELSETFTLTQVGQSFSNINGTGFQYSINVDANGVLSIVFLDDMNYLVFYQYSESAKNWVLKSTNSDIGGANPILQFSGTTPYVAAQLDSGFAYVYNFSAPQAYYTGPQFAISPDIFDFIITPSGKQIVSIYTNTSVTNSVMTNLVVISEFNGTNWIPYTGYQSYRITNYINELNLQVTKDNKIFLVVNADEQSYLFMYNNKTVNSAYPLDTKSMGIAFAIDNADNIFYTYHSTDIPFKSFYHIGTVSQPNLYPFYAKQMIDGGMADFGKQCGTVSPSRPGYYYFLGSFTNTGDMSVSVLRLSLSGELRNMKGLWTNWMDIFEFKMTSAPDGTLYVARKAITAIPPTITVWKLE